MKCPGACTQSESQAATDDIANSAILLGSFLPFHSSLFGSTWSIFGGQAQYRQRVMQYFGSYSKQSQLKGSFRHVHIRFSVALIRSPSLCLFSSLPLNSRCLVSAPSLCNRHSQALPKLLNLLVG
jgi:hypothetical protein